MSSDSPTKDLVSEFEAFVTTIVRDSDNGKNLSKVLLEEGDVAIQKQLEAELDSWVKSNIPHTSTRDSSYIADVREDELLAVPRTPQEQIGDLLEAFCLSVSTAHVPAVILELNNLETFIQYQRKALEDCCFIEPANEIVKDCRKKTSQTIRPKYSENVRNLISQSRKKLIVKTASDDTASHSQRHMQVLIELLGTWSNIIAEVESLGVQRQVNSF